MSLVMLPVRPPVGGGASTTGVAPGRTTIPVRGEDGWRAVVVQNRVAERAWGACWWICTCGGRFGEVLCARTGPGHAIGCPARNRTRVRLRSLQHLQHGGTGLQVHTPAILPSSISSLVLHHHSPTANTHASPTILQTCDATPPPILGTSLARSTTTLKVTRLSQVIHPPADIRSHHVLRCQVCDTVLYLTYSLGLS